MKSTHFLPYLAFTCLRLRLYWLATKVANLHYWINHRS